MSFMTLRLMAPGVKLVQTKTQVQTTLHATQAIRWREGLPEKLGGWAKFFGFPIPGPIRELWGWADNDLQEHLAAAGDQGVTVITNNSLVTPGPLFALRHPASIASTAGSSLFVVNDTGSNATTYESITLQTPVAVGGVVIYPGNYQITHVGSPDQYTIQANVAATATSSTDTFAALTTTKGSALITVALTAHGLAKGSNFSIVLPTTIGGLTLQGFFTVQSVVDANTFTMFAPNTALSADTQNYGNTNIQLEQWVIITQQPPGGGWGDGPWGGPAVFSSASSYAAGTFVTNTGTIYQANVAISPGAFNPSQWTAQAAGFVLTSWGQSPPPPPITGTPLLAPDWCMENFGNPLVINPQDQGLFTYDPTIGLFGSQLIVNAPSIVHGFFIAMPQQMVVAYGASTQGVQDPMLVAWCDAGNLNVWTASASNQAGTYRLTRGSRIVGGLQGPLQGMLWTDVGLWLMQYIGYPDVWGFLEITRGCGLIAKKAAIVVGVNVYWMSIDGFWMYAGMGAQRLQCDVWDAVFKNLNLAFLGNIRGAANTPYDEACWYYPSLASTSGENDSYVKFNVVTGEWDYGLLAVSEWIDQNVFGEPMSAMPADATDSFIMQHEISPDADGQPLAYSLTTGYFQLSEAEEFVFCDYCIPDFKWRRFAQAPVISAQVQLTFFVNDFPDDPTSPPIPIGPITVTNQTQAVDIRCRGRYFSIEVAGNDLGSFMRLGGLKFRIAPDGRNG